MSGTDRQLMFQNRLAKNIRKLKSWAERNRFEAYRIYDRDIPEFPFIVDRYGEFALVYDKSDSILDKDKNDLPLVASAVCEALGISAEKVVIKKRERQKGESQYDKIAERNEFVPMQEGQARFLVNLFDYLDTGLFLDHRPMRYQLFKDIQAFQKRQPSVSCRILNLFCYTGSISVFAALAGGTVTSVDMSRTYLEWAKENFKLNNIDLSLHKFLQESALEFLEQAPSKEKFDFIFLDPPTFSNSKRMAEPFEVEKDQEFLVENCMRILDPNGVLYFSNNKRSFKLSSFLTEKYSTKDISAQTIPPDFHDQKIHKCFRINFPQKPAK